MRNWLWLAIGGAGLVLFWVLYPAVWPEAQMDLRVTSD